jgi:2-oxoisovalerate dehydrogenase E1 component beta subunit
LAELNLIQAIRNGLWCALRDDPDVVVLGEKSGGAFLATDGLRSEFGPDRVIDTPRCESGIVGAAIGMALVGLHPVAEIQSIDFIYSGFDQVVSEAAKFRYRSGGQFSVPLVIRAPCGGGMGGGIYGSQSPEAHFVHTPGLKVVMPSNPYDAKGLLLASIQDPDPVIFLEPKKLYRAVKGEVPEDPYTLPLSKARLVREGRDIAIFTYGTMLYVSLEAAELALQKGISVEVIDLCTLLPYDGATILRSVRKTGRAVIVCEAQRVGSFASEIAAFIAEEVIEYLKSPILRVTGYDTPYPYALERFYQPDARRVLRAVEEAVRF